MTSTGERSGKTARLNVWVVLVSALCLFAASPEWAEGLRDPAHARPDAAGRIQESDDEPAIGPSTTPGRRKRTPTTVVNEVSGLPTPVIDLEGEGDAEKPTQTATVNRTPTTRPTATLAPTTSDDGMVASQIGPGGGSLESPLGARLEIPEGALPEVSTVSIRPVADTKLPVQRGIELVSNSGFDISMAGPDGRAIEQMAKPAEFRVQIDDDELRSGIRLYRVEGSELVPLPNTRIDGKDLVVTLNSATRVVAGAPSPVASEASRGALPFILAAAVVVVVMIGMVVLGGMFRPRRQRVVVTRRPPRQRSRYR